MTSFVQPSERDRVTVALFKRICREKAQERELLKCPCCHNILEALQLDEDSNGYQNIWWICKSTFDKSCNFPLDMPTDVFWVKRSPQQIEEGIIPRPNVGLLPEKYRHMYPSLFPGSGRPSLMGSRCASSASGTSIGSHTSVHTREMSLSSNMPSPSSSTGTYCPSMGPSEPAAMSPLAEMDDDVLLEDPGLNTRLSNDSPSVIFEVGAPSTSRNNNASRPAQSSSTVSMVADSSNGIPSTPAKDPPTKEFKSVRMEWRTVQGKPVEEDAPSTADSSFDSDEEAAYQAAISCDRFKRYRTECDTKPPTRVFTDEHYETYVMGTSGLMQALFERLDNLPVDSMADDDVMGIVQNTLAQIKQAPIRDGHPKAAIPTPQAFDDHRREYSSLALDIISNVDFPAATAIARSQPTVHILSMPFSLRQATDGQSVLKAIGTNHRGVKRKQPLDQYAIQADIEAKAQELVKRVKKRQRQKKLDVSRHLQKAESDASLKEVRESVTLAASKDRERLDQERAKQYDKEQELKSKNLFKAKFHAITEARRERQLKAQQLLLQQANQQQVETYYAEAEQSSEMDSGSGFEQGFSNNYYVNSYEETQRALHNPDDQDDDPFNNGFDIL